ncbi:MAG: right-handed parallel beta-helix repeat-containing protein [Fibromonadales bacterium]|nr:right-handed parallel beta-helix repeat-containing protein [Fibromonadales bacterium]
MQKLMKFAIAAALLGMLAGCDLSGLINRLKGGKSTNEGQTDAAVTEEGQYIEEFQGDADECGPIFECPNISGKRDIAVETPHEFVCAIGSNRNILLSEGVYNFSDCALGNIANNHVSWQNGQLNVLNVQDMSIRGTGSKPSELVVDSRDAYVMTFKDSKNITIENVSAGHSEAADGCEAGVFEFSNSSNIKINKTNMYGSGTVGLSIKYVNDMEVTNSTIYECTQSIMEIMNSSNISFKNCLFRDNMGGVYAQSTSYALLDSCEFKNNKVCDDCNFFNGGYEKSDNIIISNTSFLSNKAGKFAISDKFVFRGCVFDGNTFSDPNLFTDPRDDQTYRTVKIGDDTWMAQNLNFRAEGSLCYDNFEFNCAKYGRLYDWNTAMKACPEGWRLPGNGTWQGLFKDTGGEHLGDEWSVAGKKLKSKTGWNDNGNGTNDFSFTALPGGYFNYEGKYIKTGTEGSWWTDFNDRNGNPHLISMKSGSDNTEMGIGSVEIALSVRCVKVSD